MKKIIITAILCLSIAACNPFKVTDPNDPRFDPYKFRFSDYSRSTDYKNEVFESELYKALKIILKPGMSEEEVDRILLNDPHVKKIDIQSTQQNTKKYFYIRWYMHFLMLPTPNSPGFSVIVEYSEDNKLIRHTYRR